MSEENEIYKADQSFYDNVPWDKVANNKIEKEEYLRLKAKVKTSYVTFLGPPDSLSFYMFKPLSWGEYKVIREKRLDKDTTHEYIINNCVLYPKMDPIDIGELDAGIMLTLVYQILTVSNFVDNKDSVLNMIYQS
ncbi:MAG: hypothetical protein RBR68_13800 [Tenuifilaceae bacterium]|nr:hypothetical protein [Tenuifilaceae bacterium]